MEAVIDGETRLRQFFTERRMRSVRGYIFMVPIVTAAGLWYMYKDDISERVNVMEKENREKRLRALEIEQQVNSEENKARSERLRGI